MVNKIDKALNRFSKTERQQVKKIFERIKRQELTGLNATKLKGYSNVFRIKKGDLRIIYRIETTGFFIVSVGRRNEKTYREF